MADPRYGNLYAILYSTVTVSSFLCGTMAEAKITLNDKISIAPFFGVPSLDTSPVEIEMQSIQWRVPRNFLETAEFMNRSDDTARRLRSLTLRIVTNLSTLQGANEATLKCYKTLRADVCPDTIMMLTQWGEVSSSSWNEAAIAEAARETRNDLFGLTKVKTKISLGPQDVFVFYGGSPEQSVVIRCIEIGGGGLRECTVRYDADGVPMRYSYSRKQLPNWRRIHDGATAIIKSFRAEGEKNL